MKKEQEEFLNKVVFPKLIKMAIDCTLPSDMNELCHSHFEKEAIKFNKERRLCQNDLAVTTSYIYSDLMGGKLFFSNIDKAKDIAAKFIEKFPTGTCWDGVIPTWEEELSSFYDEYLEEDK